MLWRRCCIDAEGAAQLVSENQLPLSQVCWQVVAGQKIFFFDSGKGAIAQVIAPAHGLTLMGVEGVYFL